VTALLEAAAEEDAAYLTTGVQIAAGIKGDTEAAWLSAMSLPAIRLYAVAELNRRAGRDAQHDPLPGLEPAERDAVVMASQAIVAGYATGGPDGVAAALRQAAAPGSETALFEQIWRSRHLIAAQALMTAGKLHPDKKVAKAARAASFKAASVRNPPGAADRPGRRAGKAGGERLLALKASVPGENRPVNLVADFYELLADLGAAAWDADDPMTSSRAAGERLLRSRPLPSTGWPGGWRFPSARLPELLGRPGSSPPKLVDEFLWIRVTRGP